MSKNIILPMLLLLVFLASCTNDGYNSSEKTNKADLVSNYRALLNAEKPEGTAILQSIGYENHFGNINKTFISQSGEKPSIELFSKNKSKVNFKNRLPNKSLEDLFGNKVYLNRLKGSRNSQNDSIYIPEILTVSYSTFNIQQGTIINWNKDDKNVNGLILNITYDPLLQDDGEVIYNNQYRIHEKVFLEEGNGSYTVTQDDLDRFPNDALIKISLGRGSYDLEEGEPPFIAITTSNNSKRVEK